MKITIVADVFGELNNGTVVTVKRLMDNLEERGHEITIVSPFKSSDQKYITLDTRNFFIFNKYVAKNGVALGKPDKTKLRHAIENADLVHFIMPFKCSKAGIKIAMELKKPFTTAFHVQPQNVTSHFFMMNSKLANKLIYKYFLKGLYQYSEFIHCPSKFIADQLENNGYKAKKYVISNGVIPTFKKMKVDKPTFLRGNICILFTGRYSKEKRHDLLIEAAKLSKYSDKIQLIFAGVGPQRKKMEKASRSLKNPPIMRLFTKEQLCEVINFCDLYVHPSDFEIEAISCIEAFTCGTVPVISNNDQSATKQFALTENNLFEHGNAQDLANKIDFWIEHPEEKAELSKKYIEYAKQFSIASCIDQMEKMFYNAVEFYKDFYAKQE